jgi:hypothetical protein
MTQTKGDIRKQRCFPVISRLCGGLPQQVGAGRTELSRRAALV